MTFSFVKLSFPCRYILGKKSKEHTVMRFTRLGTVAEVKQKTVSKYLRPALLHEHTTTHASLHTQTHTHVLGYKIVVESDCVIILHDSIPFLRAIIESLKPAIFKIYLAINHKVGTTFNDVVCRLISVL